MSYRRVKLKKHQNDTFLIAIIRHRTYNIRIETPTVANTGDQRHMKISQEVQQILSAAEVTGNMLRLTGQLDRPTYQAVDKVIKVLGGKWDRKSGTHVFGEDVEDVIDAVIATGEYVDTKKIHQQFFTPQVLAARVVELADIQHGDTVLEPSCGPGAIVAEIIKKTPADNVIAFEIDAKQHAICEEKYLKGSAAETSICDFLHMIPVEPSADKICMNPPFSKAQDVIHVTHAMRFLKPGGTLVAIMSPGVKFRQGKKYDEFRALMDAHKGEMFDVDEGAFKESGTQIRTVIVRMRKPAQ